MVGYRIVRFYAGASPRTQPLFYELIARLTGHYTGVSAELEKHDMLQVYHCINTWRNRQWLSYAHTSSRLGRIALAVSALPALSYCGRLRQTRLGSYSAYMLARCRHLIQCHHRLTYHNKPTEPATLIDWGVATYSLFYQLCNYPVRAPTSPTDATRRPCIEQ